MVDGTEGDARLVGDRAEWTLSDADARRYVRRATQATTALVESTFGPPGSESLVETEDPQGDPEIVRTGDAGRLFDAIDRGDGFSHPVVALFVDAVDGMQRGLGDGTTTATVIAGALLEEGFELIEQGLAPNSVISGYGMARNHVGTTLDELARPVGVDDMATLRQVAATTLTLDLEPEVRSEYAERVAVAVSALADAGDSGWVNTDDAAVLAARGAEGALTRGLILSRPLDAESTSSGVERALSDVTVAVLDAEIDFEATASVLGGGDGVRLNSAEASDAYRSGLEERIESMATCLAADGVDVLVCQEKLDAEITHPLERAGIAVVDKAMYPKSDVYRLSRATGATAVSDVGDLTPERLGRAGRVSERRVGDEVWTAFEDCPGSVHTLVIGADTREEVDRRRAAIGDALETTAIAAMDEQVLPGACAPAAAAATALRTYAPNISGREQLAVEGFADALDRLPYTLARNAGLDPIDATARLRAAHGSADAPSAAGIDLDGAEPTDAWGAGVVEPRRVFSQAVETAAAIVEQLLTIDAILYPNVDLPEYTPRSTHE